MADVCEICPLSLESVVVLFLFGNMDVSTLFKSKQICVCTGNILYPYISYKCI